MNNLRAKMPNSQRAKQFVPFDAVVGLRASLKEKEIIKVEKKTLCEDMEVEINKTIKSIKDGNIVTVVYYDIIEKQYFQLTGIVTKINFISKYIDFSGKIISFDDIYEIENHFEQNSL